VLPFVIAAAQTSSVKGDVEANVRAHIECVRVALDHGAHLVVFPELSLTGYEPELAADLILAADDERLRGLADLARQSGITLIAGAPIASGEDKPHLGALIFKPDETLTYAKQHLHAGEERFFTPGKRACVVDLKGVRVGVAICADTMQASHPREAAASGARVYAAGVVFTEKGYAADAALLSGYASTHRMAVAMANHSAPTGNYVPAGRSAIWDEQGEIVACADGAEQALVIAEKAAALWNGKVVPL
jgi:predicted amidohydrolase